MKDTYDDIVFAGMGGIVFGRIPGGVKVMRYVICEVKIVRKKNLSTIELPLYVMACGEAKNSKKRIQEEQEKYE